MSNHREFHGELSGSIPADLPDPSLATVRVTEAPERKGRRSHGVFLGTPERVAPGRGWRTTFMSI